MMQRAVFGLLPVLFFFLLVGTASAQYVFREPKPTPTPRPSPAASLDSRVMPCPTVSIQAHGGAPVRDGQKLNFALNLSGGDPKVSPIIVWSAPGGAITQGHGTRRIEVDSTGAGSTPYREVRAEVWVGGYAPECLLQATATVKIIAPAAKFGEFPVLDGEGFKKNIDSLAEFLSQSTDNLYLIAYAGRNSERGFTFQWLKRIKDGLVEAGYSARRIAAVDGGFREEPVIDLWLVPTGAEPPRPTPTVKRSEIVYPNTRTPPPKRP